MRTLCHFLISFIKQSNTFQKKKLSFNKTAAFLQSHSTLPHLYLTVLCVTSDTYVSCHNFMEILCSTYIFCRANVSGVQQYNAQTMILEITLQPGNCILNTFLIICFGLIATHKDIVASEASNSRHVCFYRPILFSCVAYQGRIHPQK